MKIGFIGLGIMGKPMALNLIKGVIVSLLSMLIIDGTIARSMIYCLVFLYLSHCYRELKDYSHSIVPVGFGVRS